MGAGCSLGSSTASPRPSASFWSGVGNTRLNGAENWPISAFRRMCRCIVFGSLDAVLRARRYFHTNDNLMIHYSDCLTSTGAAQITMDECLASPPAGDAAAV